MAILWVKSNTYTFGSRRNEVAVFAFLAPMLLLMKIPIVGPLLFLPVGCHCWNAALYLSSFGRSC